MKLLEEAKKEEERRNKQYMERLVGIELNIEKQQKWYVAREIATYSVAVLSAVAGCYVGFEFGHEDISSSVDVLEGTVKGAAVGLGLILFRTLSERIYGNYRERKARARVEERLELRSNQ